MSRTADVRTGSLRIADAIVRWSLLLGFTLLFGSVSLVYPFGRDQAIYAFLGNAMLHGMTLYRDVPIMLMPMTCLVHALSQLLFGHTFAAIRILDLLWITATVSVLALLVTRLFQRPWLGVIAGLILSFTYYSLDNWATAQVDGFLNLPLVTSLYLLTGGLSRGGSSPEPSQRRVWSAFGIWFVAGLLMGTALLFKYTMGLLVPGVTVTLILACGRPRAAGWWAAAWFCGGCLAAGFGVLLSMALSGALIPFIKLQLGTTMPYARLYRQVSLRNAQGYFPSPTLPAFLLGVPGLVAAVGMLARERRAASSLVSYVALVIVWLVSALASIVVQGKFFGYHYLPALPPLAVLGAMAVASASKPLANRLASTRRRAALVGVALVTLALGTGYPSRYADMVRVASNRLTLHDLWSRRDFSLWQYRLPENTALNRYLIANTRTTDRVSNLDRDSPFTFPAWRRPILRLAKTNSIDPAVWRLSDELRVSPPNVITVKRGEGFMGWDKAATQSTYERLMSFAFSHGEVVHWLPAENRDGYDLLMAFTALRDFAAKHYEMEARIGHYDVLRLANSDSVLPVSADSQTDLREDLAEALDWISTNSGSAGHHCDSVRTILWPLGVPEGLDSSLASKMVSHKRANWLLWSGERRLAEMMPGQSVWIANDNRPFARLEPFKLQNDGRDYDAAGASFRVLHRCRNGLVLVYDLRTTPSSPYRDVGTNLTCSNSPVAKSVILQ